MCSTRTVSKFHILNFAGSASLIELERYQDALDDSKKALEIDSSYMKAYMRKAEAERELLLNDDALKTLEHAISTDQESEYGQLSEMYEEHKKEYEDDHQIEDTDPQKIRFDKLEQWLHEGGSKYDKLKIRFYNPIYRGVHAARKIKAGEEILLIPKKQIMTLEMAESSILGKKMMNHNMKMRLLSPKHSFLTTFILQELEQGEESYFFPFIDILPKTFENFPIFFSPEEKVFLEGSPFLNQVEEKIEDIKQDYNLICENVPEYERFGIKEFSEIRMMVSSRIFGMKIEGKKTDGFVPMADMLNHKRPKQTTWTYTDEKEGFSIDAIVDVERNDEIFDSYGKKCNSRFFLNYGFIVRNNDANEVPLKIFYPPGDKYKQLKQDMINDESDFKKFRVSANLRDSNMYEFFSWARFVEFDENYTILVDFQARTANKNSHHDDSDDEHDDPNKGFKAKELPPLSIRNEKKVIMRMKLESATLLSKYPTTLEEDIEFLKNDEEGSGPEPLKSDNLRNSILMRSGEKAVLKYLIECADIFYPMFDMTLQEAMKANKGNDYSEDQNDYIKSVIFHLIKNNE